MSPNTSKQTARTEENRFRSDAFCAEISFLGPGSWDLGPGSGSGSAAEARLSCAEARADPRKWKKRASPRNREKTGREQMVLMLLGHNGHRGSRVQGSWWRGWGLGRGVGGGAVGGQEQGSGLGPPGALPSLGCGAGGLDHVQPPVLPSAPAWRERRPGCGYCRRVPSVKRVLELRPLHFCSLLIRTMC